MFALITTPTALNDADQDAIRQLAETIAATDGGQPLSDQGRINLSSLEVTHVVARCGSQITGYAQLNPSPGAAAAVEVLGEPSAIDALLDTVQHNCREIDLWAHGQGSRLIEFAERRGYIRARVLSQLRWPVGDLPAPSLPAGVSLRSFVPGQDEDAWLAVNAAAFVHHPEQGGWTRDDLLRREAANWFDPASFLLAEQDGEVIGFHWTKVHTPTLGEVYVIGVAPRAQRMHLGTALLVAGLAHLRRGGSTEVMLYVDESNTTAMAMYERFGFLRFDHDIQYRYTHG